MVFVKERRASRWENSDPKHTHSIEVDTEIRFYATLCSIKRSAYIFHVAVPAGQKYSFLKSDQTALCGKVLRAD